MECSICNRIKQPTSEKKYPCFSCDSCKKIICAECSELSTSELRCIPMQKRMLIYHCKTCKNFEFAKTLQDTIADKKKIIDDQETIIKLLKEKIETLEKAKHMSYATVVEQNKHGSTTAVVKSNIPKIIVKPKQQQSSEETKKQIGNNINPTELKVGIMEMKSTKFGNMVIKCQTKQGVEILKQELDSKLKDEYSIELSKLKNPRIKIVKVTHDYSNEKIEKCLKKQNDLIGDVKVTFIRKNKDGTKTIICECMPNTFHQIMKLKKLCIGWERYAVYEDLTIPKCFNCQEFFHKQHECQNKIVCPICSDEHNEKICPKLKTFCRNCKEANIKHKTSHATDHQVNSPECPTLKHHIDVLKSKINYTG